MSNRLIEMPVFTFCVRCGRGMPNPDAGAMVTVQALAAPNHHHLLCALCHQAHKRWLAYDPAKQEVVPHG